MLKKVTTLSFIYDEKKILLAYKKRGFGINWWNGFGGKIKEGESLQESAKREIKEESGLTVSRLERRAILNFEIKTEDIPLEVHVFKVIKYTGLPIETSEMRPKWFDIDKIPYDGMWSDDKYWIPLFLTDKILIGNFYFENNETMLDYNLKIIR